MLIEQLNLVMLTHDGLECSPQCGYIGFADNIISVCVKDAATVKDQDKEGCRTGWLCQVGQFDGGTGVLVVAIIGPVLIRDRPPKLWTLAQNKEGRFWNGLERLKDPL